MTFCFIQAIERGHGQGATYGSILTAMRHAIRGAGNNAGGGGAVTSLIGMLLTGGSVSGGFQQVLPHLILIYFSLMSHILIIIHAGRYSVYKRWSYFLLSFFLLPFPNIKVCIIHNWT